MARVYVDKRMWFIIGCVLIVGGLTLFFEVRAALMKGDFIDTIRAGQIDNIVIRIRDKVWSDAELDDVEMLSFRRQRASDTRGVLHMLHTRGRAVLSRQQFAYQATLEDSDTGIKYVFGYGYDNQARWTWVTIHPDSLGMIVEMAEQEMERVRQDALSP